MDRSFEKSSGWMRRGGGRGGEVEKEAEAEAAEEEEEDDAAEEEELGGEGEALFAIANAGGVCKLWGETETL